jgi:sigma-B regulation protein RsbU (phosphoserine phosphatase)
MSGSAERHGQDNERRLIELSDLLEISQTLNQSLELETILNHLLLASMGRFAIGRGAFLLPCAEGRYRVAAAKGLPDTPVGTEVDLNEPPEMALEIADTSDEALSFFTSRKLAILIPLRRATGQCVGMLALGAKLTRKPFEPEEIEFLTSLANVATPAIENSRVYGELQSLAARLDRKIHELNTLFEIGRRFVGTLEAAEVLKLFAYALMGQLLLTRFAIVLRRPSGPIVHLRGISAPETPVWTDDAFWTQLAELEGPGPIDDACPSALAELGLTGIVPIRKEDVTHGFVGLGPRAGGKPYSEDELAFSSALANQAIVALENAWLIEETIENRRLEEELAIASNIQSLLFPKSLPTIEGYELAARSKPTRHVGGDYYDTIELGDGRVLIAIADVSGKGVPAALLMSNVQASLRALAGPSMDLAANAGKISEIIYTNTDFNKYATFFYGILDPSQHTFVYTNAGHNPPILLRASGESETLDAGGLPVGIMPGSTYEHGAVTVGAGDTLVMYTDGVTEASNTADEEYGEERLLSLAKAGSERAALEFLESVYEDVFSFAAGMPQGDDITMVVLKRFANP